MNTFIRVYLVYYCLNTMGKFRICDETPIEKNDYISKNEGNNLYFNMNQEEKLIKDLNVNGNKIINVDDTSDVVTKSEGTKLEARVSKSLSDKIDKNTEINMNNNKIINENLALKADLTLLVGKVDKADVNNLIKEISNEQGVKIKSGVTSSTLLPTNFYLTPLLLNSVGHNYNIIKVQFQRIDNNWFDANSYMFEHDIKGVIFEIYENNDGLYLKHLNPFPNGWNKKYRVFYNKILVINDASIPQIV